MKLALSAFISGFIFASGLALSGMTNPSNVLGFLNLTGTWKPALMFVMVAAILVSSIVRPFIMKRSRPIFDKQFHVPDIGRIDSKLVLGSAIFGLGWGIGGYCPGPAIASIGAGAHDAIIFVLFMMAGMAIQRFWEINKR